nr:MAG TPA: hypothetical protein [Caudoviricetes sp.]
MLLRELGTDVNLPFYSICSCVVMAMGVQLPQPRLP